MKLKDLAGDTKPKRQKAPQFQAEMGIKTFTAARMMVIDFPKAFVDEMNEYIDNVIIPNDEDYSHSLVGQIRQNEKSKQLNFSLEGNEYVEQFKKVLDNCGSTFVQKAYKRESVANSFEAWTVHSYEGDYNPLHDHDVSYDRKCMAFSIILYCLVPPQIAKLGDSTKLHSNGGATDGCTYFNWGTNTGADHLVLKPKTDRYVVPEEGKFLIFPSWLNHSVAPFYGKGERRTLSANFRVPFSSTAKDESSGDLHFKNMFERDKEPEVTADTPIDDIL